MGTNVSILAEIPEDLHLSMQGYLNGNPDWDQDRVFSAAISLFLLQNTVENTPEASLNYRRAARVYLETLFRDQPDVSLADVEESVVEEPISSTIEPEVIADDTTPADQRLPLDSKLNTTASPIEPQHHIDAA